MHQTICCQFVQKIPCLPDPFRGPSVGMMSFQLAQVLGEKPKGFRPKMHQLKIHNNPSVTWAGKPRLGTTPGILHLDGRGHSGFCVCVCHPSQIYSRWFALLKTESIRRIFEYNIIEIFDETW